MNQKPFLLITANEHETDALLLDKNFFVFDPNQRSSIPEDTLFYNIGKFGEYNVVHFELPDQGSTQSDAALASTLMAIDAWKPIAVILVGIAFGKDNENIPEPRQHIGDVLISEKIADYESGKIKNKTIYSDGAIPECGRHLKSVFKNYKKSWIHNINGLNAMCEFGLLLSGDKVVDDRAFKQALFDRYPRAIGGEMEGRGAYAACRIKGINEWIIVKAICDWGEDKNNPHKKRDQICAADSAVSLLKHVFSDPNSLKKICSTNIPTSLPIDESEFICDVTYPDGGIVKTNQKITKIWRIKNSGTVLWQNRRLMRITPNAPTLPKSPLYVDIPTTHPNQIIDISVDFEIPNIESTFFIQYKMVDKQDRYIYPLSQYSIGLAICLTSRKNGE